MPHTARLAYPGFQAKNYCFFLSSHPDGMLQCNSMADYPSPHPPALPHTKHLSGCPSSLLVAECHTCKSQVHRLIVGSFVDRNKTWGIIVERNEIFFGFSYDLHNCLLPKLSKMNFPWYNPKENNHGYTVIKIAPPKSILFIWVK